MVGLDIRSLHFQIGKFEMIDVNLSVRQSEYVVLTGPNGSGKSLLIKMICGLHTPSSGQISIGDRPILQQPPWNRRIGYVPQEGVLFPNRDVRRNIEFGLEVRGIHTSERSQALSRVVGLLKIEHLLERMPTGLSGGERQKVSLARALVLSPELLLLDEPVSAIDEDFRDGLCRDLRHIQQELGVTTLHVSHNRHETRLVADRVALMDNGRMLDTLPLSEFLNNGDAA